MRSFAMLTWLTLLLIHSSCGEANASDGMRSEAYGNVYQFDSNDWDVCSIKNRSSYISETWNYKDAIVAYVRIAKSADWVQYQKNDMTKGYETYLERGEVSFYLEATSIAGYDGRFFGVRSGADPNVNLVTYYASFEIGEVAVFLDIRGVGLDVSIVREFLASLSILTLEFNPQEYVESRSNTCPGDNELKDATGLVLK